MAIPAEAFFEHSTWSSERLLLVCERLSDEQLDATGNGAFGSIRETLTHTFATEQLYLRRLGHTLDANVIDEAEFPGFDLLKRAAQANGAALATLARMASPELIVTGALDDGFIEASATVLLVQTLNHSTEHRTQILSILSTLGAGPTDLDEQIDGWSWGAANGTLQPRT